MAPSTQAKPGTADDVTLAEPHAEHARARREAAPGVAGYTVERIIGRGGMGIVWSAIEHRLDRRVALKVQAESLAPERVAKLWGEARLAAKVTDPGVVPVHDFGYTLDGDPFYTMDLVEGTDLRALLREAPLPAQRALELAEQIARAVGAAHERGIVHRDLKPSNVLVDTSGRARVLDFGLAFDPTLGDSYANLLAGTPAYMSPEQISGDRIGPPSDVHAIGVMLYEMLTGKRPWDAKGYAVLELIGKEPPTPLSQQGASVPADVEEMCMRCLARSPEERFPDARALADALEAVRVGKPLAGAAGLRPARTNRASDSPAPEGAEATVRDEAPFHCTWTWRLRSRPAALWTYVSNTDRVNKAVGLDPVAFTDEKDAVDGSTRHGSFRALGMQVEWREYPFEWVAAREHSVYRLYRKGPIAALWNRLRLEPTPEGSTQLTHEIWAKPRGVLGRLAAYVEIERKLGHGFDRVYKRIDDCLMEGKGVDPFEGPCKPTADQSKLVAAAARRLVAGGFDPELVSRLSLFVLCEPVKRLERMRPFELADAWKVEREGMLELFLHAAYSGMLEFSWDAICPRCRIAHETFESLDTLARASTCTPCGTSYERDLAESVEIVFRPHPDLRGAGPGTYCAGAPALRPHVLVQQRVGAGERRVATFDLPAGTYALAADWPCRSQELVSSGAGFLSTCEVVMRAEGIDARPAVLHAGRVEITLVNETQTEQLVRLELQGARENAVTAAAVMTRPSFQELFSEELLAEGQPVSVRRMAFLCLDVQERARLFAEQGDAGAWAVLRGLDPLVDEALRTHRGALVPAPLGAYVMAFGSSEWALEAAVAVLDAWRKTSPASGLRASLHDGPCIAVTREHRAEYFGKTVDRAMSLLAEAPRDGIAASDAFTSDREVARRIRERNLAVEVTSSETGAYAGTRITRLRLPSVPAASG